MENRQQRVKINGAFSKFQNLSLGVPQGSVLGPLFFNIYINDLLLSIQETSICNYADDTTIFTSGKNLDNVIMRLESDSTVIIQWFQDNFMKLNAEKCHFMVLGRSADQTITVRIGNSTIENSREEKLLGVIIDRKLTFETHINKLCKKAGNKLFALSRLSLYIESSKLQILMRAFVMSQFQYCPLAWMFHSKHLNAKIDKIQERALRIAYKDFDSSFEYLLERDNSLTIHAKNLQTLLTEVFKTHKHLNPNFMKEIFTERENMYNLRNNNEFEIPRVRTVNFGSETIRYRGPQLWLSLSTETKNAGSIREFKSKIKYWNCDECLCKICRPFIKNLGFL